MKSFLSRLSLILLACLALLSSAGCAANPAASTAGATPTPIPTSPAAAKPTYTVEQGEVIEQIQFNGRVVPQVQQALFFRAEGRVRSVYVREGDRVKAGDVLADLESIADLQRRVAFQKLTLERAQIAVKNAQLSLELFQLNTPQSSRGYAALLEMRQNELRLAEIGLEETTLALTELEDTSADAQIVAPIDGTVASVRLAEGRSVKAFDEVIVVADSSTLEISAELSTDEMDNLSEGMPAAVVFSSRPGEEVAGSIRRLPPPYGKSGGSGVESNDRSTRIILDGGAKMKAGDTVRVTILIDRHPNTLWLPPQAVRNFEGRRFVVVLDGTIQRRVDVKIGLSGEDRVEILEGLSAGQVVVAP